MVARKAGLVSIVVTSYNRRTYIQACLTSLIRQHYKNIEIIVVDDASTDGTWQRIQGWRRQLHNSDRHKVITVRLPRNVGYSGALTSGMFLAGGEFIAIQDSDDLSRPTRIMKQVQYLRTHPNIAMVGTNYALLRGSKIVAVPQSSVWLKFDPLAITRSYKQGKHCMCVGTLMIRGRLFDRFGGLTRRVRGAEDWELVDKLISHGVRGNNLRDPLYIVRVHQSQRSHQFYRK